MVNVYLLPKSGNLTKFRQHPPSHDTSCNTCNLFQLLSNNLDNLFQLTSILSLFMQHFLISATSLNSWIVCKLMKTRTAHVTFPKTTSVQTFNKSTKSMHFNHFNSFKHDKSFPVTLNHCQPVYEVSTIQIPF